MAGRRADSVGCDRESVCGAGEGADKERDGVGAVGVFASKAHVGEG